MALQYLCNFQVFSYNLQTVEAMLFHTVLVAVHRRWGETDKAGVLYHTVCHSEY